MILVKVVALVLIAFFWRLGGWDKAKWSGFRDVLVPIAIGGIIGWQMDGLLWQKILIGVLTIGSYNIIRMGYGSYDPENDDKPSFLAKITKDRKGYIIRSIVGTLYGLIGLLPLLIFSIITHNLAFLKIYGAYSLYNGFTGFLVTKFKANDWVTELSVGAGVGSIIFLIH